MLSSSLYTMLKMYKTTYPQNLFPSDCTTLYECLLNIIINCTRRKHGRVVDFHSDPDRDPWSVSWKNRTRILFKIVKIPKMSKTFISIKINILQNITYCELNKSVISILRIWNSGDIYLFFREFLMVLTNFLLATRILIQEVFQM